MEYITQRQAARLLDVDESTIWRWRQAGLLQTYQIAGHILLSKRAVQRLSRPRRGRPPTR